MTKIHVEYCSNYEGRYRSLTNAMNEDLGFLLEEKVPEVSGAVGRKNSFEITIDDVLIYSKLATGKFPDLLWLPPL